MWIDMVSICLRMAILRPQPVFQAVQTSEALHRLKNPHVSNNNKFNNNNSCVESWILCNRWKSYEKLMFYGVLDILCSIECFVKVKSLWEVECLFIKAKSKMLGIKVWWVKAENEL